MSQREKDTLHAEEHYDAFRARAFADGAAYGRAQCAKEIADRLQKILTAQPKDWLDVMNLYSELRERDERNAQKEPA